MGSSTIKVRRGAIALPPELRDRYGLDEGTEVIAEDDGDGIHLRPASWPEVEDYTPERIAEFLLTNSVDAEDYAWAVAEVRKIRLAPEEILHDRPPGV